MLRLRSAYAGKLLGLGACARSDHHCSRDKYTRLPRHRSIPGGGGRTLASTKYVGACVPRFRNCVDPAAVCILIIDTTKCQCQTNAYANARRLSRARRRKTDRTSTDVIETTGNLIPYDCCVHCDPQWQFAIVGCIARAVASDAVGCRETLRRLVCSAVCAAEATGRCRGSE